MSCRTCTSKVCLDQECRRVSLLPLPHQRHAEEELLIERRDLWRLDDGSLASRADWEKANGTPVPSPPDFNSSFGAEIHLAKEPEPK